MLSKFGGEPFWMWPSGRTPGGCCPWQASGHLGFRVLGFRRPLIRDLRPFVLATDLRFDLDCSFGGLV